MHTVEARNVNQAYHHLMWVVDQYGVEVSTRNGVATTLESPVALSISRPHERVLFDAERNCNPFFHIVEGIWMLAGRNDVEFLDEFNSNMKTYSDDGRTFNAAYGHRWRKYFDYDQLEVAIDMLIKNPLDRRVVISMWDPYVDLGSKSLDIPCNTQIMPRVRGKYLDMLTTNRSNDLVFGLCGANAVHLTMLQEFMAASLGLHVGEWHHVTNNLHVYERHYPLLRPQTPVTAYPATEVMVQSPIRFHAECMLLCEGVTSGFMEPFMARTVSPMIRAWREYKGGEFEEAMLAMDRVWSEDWRKAGREWIIRAQEKKNDKT